MTTSAESPPAGSYRPSRVTLYHVAVSAIDTAFGLAGVPERVKNIMSVFMRELLPLDASEEAFDEEHAKVLAIERAVGDRTVAIPFVAAIAAVGNSQAVQVAELQAMQMCAGQMTRGLPLAPRAFGGIYDRSARPSSPTSIRTPFVEATPMCTPFVEPTPMMHVPMELIIPIDNSLASRWTPSTWTQRLPRRAFVIGPCASSRLSPEELSADPINDVD